MPKRKRRTKAPKTSRYAPLLTWFTNNPAGVWVRCAYGACTSPSLRPLIPRRDAIALGIVFAAVLLLYAASTPRTVMMEDDGIFILAAQYLGVAHPPGYPFYVLLSWLATWFPFESIAWRVHALSGLMGAVTCVCIALIVLRRSGNLLAACFAGAGLAVSEHFWSQALIADVYTTNTALVFVTLLLIQEASVQRKQWLWLAAAVGYGIGLSTHWPLWFLGTPMLAFYALAARGDFWRRSWYLIALGLLTTAALYGWMVWRSQQQPVISFLGPISSWKGFIAFVSRDVYSGVDNQIDADWVDKLLYGRYLLTQLWWQFGPLGMLVAICGVYEGVRRGFRCGVIGEIIAFLCSTVLLLIMLGFDYEPLEIAVFRPYQLVTYCIFTLWFGYGLAIIANTIGPHHRWLQGLLWSSVALSLLAVGTANARINYRANDTFAADQAQSILAMVEKNAILVTYGDFDTPQIAYLHLIEGQRPDIRLMNMNGLVLRDRIVHPLWGKDLKNNAWNAFFDRTKRPIYCTTVNPVKKAGVENLGYLYKLSPHIKPNTYQLVESEPAKIFFRQLINTPDSHDRWVDYRRNALLKKYGRYLGHLLVVYNMQPNAYIADILPLIESNYWSLVGMLDVVLRKSARPPLEWIAKRLLKAKNLARDDRNKRDVARFYYLEGLFAQKSDNMEEARMHYQKALKVEKNSPARKALQALMQ